MSIRISRDDVYWVVIVDGEQVHAADTKERAREWAEQRGVDPDRIAAAIPWDFGHSPI